MLKDLTRSDWMNILKLPAERIPRVLILRGTRNLRTQYEAAAKHFTNILDVGSPNAIIEDVFIGDHCGVPVGFACVYGAPMAAEIVHIFGMLGTKVVLQTGNCGAIADDLEAGDLFLATSAYCGEGASQYYKANGAFVTASTELCSSQTLTRFGLDKLYTGMIWTTAALLAEGNEDLQCWHQQGFAAVDMETATTFAVAESFGMQRLSLLYVFDNPRRREHLLLSDAEKDRRRQRGNELAQQLVLELAVELS